MKETMLIFFSLENPLATNFSILTGRHEITVPNVPSDSTYNIVCK